MQLAPAPQVRLGCTSAPAEGGGIQSRVITRRDTTSGEGRRDCRSEHEPSVCLYKKYFTFNLLQLIFLTLSYLPALPQQKKIRSMSQGHSVSVSDLIRMGDSNAVRLNCPFKH